MHFPPPSSGVESQHKPTQTPSTTRIHDMLGPTDMGELSVIFGELVQMLKELPPGGFDKAYGTQPLATAANKPISFLCDKQSFKDVVRLAELGSRLAEQAHNPEEQAPDQFTETIMAGIKSLGAKVDQLALNTAVLTVKQTTPPKSFAQALSTNRHKEEPRSQSVPGVKGKKNPPTLVRHPPPPRISPWRS